jgi:hypothetical protein
MSMMLTFRAGKLAALIVSVAVLGGCSREQQDWRSAEASDTVDGYGQFLQRHPDSELATEARTRVAQLTEDREWQRAGAADTADAYKQFLAQHPNGKWSQEARIRMENFALGREGSSVGSGSASTAGSPAATGSPGFASTAGSAVPSVSGSGSGSAGSGEGAHAFPDESARAQTSSGMTASGEAARTSSGQATPGELARPPVSAQVSPGEPARAAAQMSAQASSSAAALMQGAMTQGSSAIATAWRSSEGFGVQLGAFASENAATSEWQQLTARFSAQLRGLAPRVISANTSTGRLFRLQALVADEAAARALCDMLKKQSQACVPVLPH